MLKQIIHSGRFRGLLITMLICKGVIVSANPFFSSKNDEIKVTAEEEEAKTYLDDLEIPYSDKCNIERLARWEYTINMNPTTEAAYKAAAEEFVIFQQEKQIEVLNNFSDFTTYYPKVRHAIKILRLQGRGMMEETEFEKMTELENDMARNYSQVTVCEYLNPSRCGMNLNVVQEIMRTSLEPEELKYYFNKWHSIVSEKFTADQYYSYVQLQNEFARKNNFNSRTEMLLDDYNDGSVEWSAKEFREHIFGEWNKVLPVYQKFLKYLNQEMRNKPVYNELINSDKMPPYLMGDLWGEDMMKWEKEINPYPNNEFDAIVSKQIQEKMKVTGMFESADALLATMELPSVVNAAFLSNSLLKLDPNLNTDCQAEAFDLCKDQEFRVRMCLEEPKLTLKDLGTVYEIVGQVQYFHQYKDLWAPLRKSITPAMAETIGKILVSQLQLPEYLQCTLKLDIGHEELCSPTTISPTSTTNIATITATREPTTTAITAEPTTTTTTTEPTTTTTTTEPTTTTTTTEPTTTTTTTEPTATTTTTEPTTLDPTEEPTTLDPTEEPFDLADELLDPDDEPIDLADELLDPDDEPIDLADERLDPDDEQIDLADELLDPDDEPIDLADERLHHDNEPIYPSEEAIYVKTDLSPKGKLSLNDNNVAQINRNDINFPLRKVESIEEIENILLYKELLDYGSIAFAMVVEKWRLEVYDENLHPSKYNTLWWQLRSDYQGMEMPDDADIAASFDPASNFGVLSNQPYLSHFIGHLLRFQMMEHLCTAAGQYNREDPNSNPLHRCDLSGNKIAGNILREIMELGAGATFQDVLNKAQIKDPLSADAMIDYFTPIMEKLQGPNEGNSSKKSSASAIIAGVIIAVAVVAVVAGFFIGKRISKAKNQD